MAAALTAVAFLAACGSGDNDDAEGGSNHAPAELSELPDVRPGVYNLALAAGVGDPNEVEMPQPEEELAPWLAGDGSSAVEFVAAVDGLWSAEPDCDAVAAKLDAFGTPEVLLATISEAPDEPTRDVLLGTYYGALRALATCGSPDFPKEQADFAWQWAVADSRIRQATA